MWNARNMIGLAAVALIGVAGAGAETVSEFQASEAAVYVRSAAPAFSAPTRARLSEEARTATNAPVWEGQVGPARFADQFDDGELGTSWQAHQRESNGWWALNDWRADHVRATGDGVKLVLAKSGVTGAAPMSSGEITRRDQFRYGYFESRLRASRGAGVVSGFFTFARNGDDERSWNEIDVEILGRDTTMVELTIHAEGRSDHRKLDLGFDAADEFHTYGVEWTPDAVRWFVDGVMVHEVTGRIVKRLNSEQKLHLTLTGTNRLDGWAGQLNPEGGPYEMDVACVAYAPAYGGQSLCAEQP